MFETLRQVQTANDFKVKVTDADWPDKWIKLITAQTTGVDVNLAWKRVTLYVRQLRAGEIQELLFHVLSGTYRKIDEVRITPAKRQSYEMVFTDGYVVDHEVQFDYNDRKELVHTVVIEFNEVTQFTPESRALVPRTTISD